MPVTTIAGGEAGAALGFGDIIGGLFGGAAADAGGAIAADVGLTAADVGLEGAGALGAEVAAGTAPEVLASAAPAIAAGDIGAQVAAEGGLAATDLGLAGAEAVGPALAGAIDTSAPAVQAIASESLGGGQGALAGLNTVDTAAVPAQGLAVGSSAPGTTAGIPALSGGGADIAAPVSTPTAALQDVGGSSQNLNALLGETPQSTATLEGAPTQLASIDTASDANVIVPAEHTADVPLAESGSGIAGPASTASAATDTAGGLSAGTQAALSDIGGSMGTASAGLDSTLAGAPASTGGTLTSGLSDVLNSPWTRAAELGLPLGFLGYNLLRGPQPIPPQAQEAVTNAETNLRPLQGAATQNLNQWNQAASQDLTAAQNFQLTPGMAAEVDTYVNNATNALIQQIVGHGGGSGAMGGDFRNTSEYVQGVQQINQQASVMRQQMVQQLFTNAVSSQAQVNGSVSTDANLNSQLDNTLMTAANLQVQQDQQFNTAVSGALQSFGMLAAISTLGGRGITASPAGGGSGQAVGATA